MSLGEIDKEKRDFLDAMKGSYYLSIDLRKKSIFYEYILDTFHQEHIDSHRLFKDYEKL